VRGKGQGIRSERICIHRDSTGRLGGVDMEQASRRMDLGRQFGIG
jgi:hypothetical protein